MSVPDAQRGTEVRRRIEIQRWIPLLMIVAGMTFVVSTGWHRELSLASIAENRERLRVIIGQHLILAPLAYIAVYASAVALSLPGAAVCTITSGLLFGWLEGGLVAVAGASIGATIIFLVAKTALAESLRRAAGPWLAKLQDGFNKDALSYLLFLRLVPGFPFFIVNLVPALLGVRLRTYLIGTFFGIIPATFAFASIGAGLDSVVASAKSDFDACVLAKGSQACELKINLTALITPEIKLAFLLLAIAALIPVALKKWRLRHEH